jgi:Rrf2 family transcriptional regulator, nitric oxide-sensitive transcriptional repressor
MRLTFSTDYALRLLMLVGLEPQRLVTIEEVADRFGISKNHLMKVAYQLGQAGYLETVRGRNGGLRLGKTKAAASLSSRNFCRSISEEKCRV